MLYPCRGREVDGYVRLKFAHDSVVCESVVRKHRFAIGESVGEVGNGCGTDATPLVTRSSPRLLRNELPKLPREAESSMVPWWYARLLTSL